MTAKDPFRDRLNRALDRGVSAELERQREEAVLAEREIIRQADYQRHLAEEAPALVADFMGLYRQALKSGVPIIAEHFKLGSVEIRAGQTVAYAHLIPGNIHTCLRARGNFVNHKSVDEAFDWVIEALAPEIRGITIKNRGHGLDH